MAKNDEFLLLHAINGALHHDMNDFITQMLVNVAKEQWSDSSWNQQIMHDVEVALGLTDMAEWWVSPIALKQIDIWYQLLETRSMEQKSKMVKKRYERYRLELKKEQEESNIRIENYIQLCLKEVQERVNQI